LDAPSTWDPVRELFESCPDSYVQQSPDWARAIAPLGPDRAAFALALHAGKPVAALPLYAFDGPAGTIVTSVPQAGPLGGIFCAPDLNATTRDGAYAALLQQTLSWATEQRAALLSIITDPLTDDVDLYRRHLCAELEFENFTQIVRVADVVAQDALTLTGPTATRLRHGPRHGLKARLLSPDEFPRWYALHCRRHSQLGAATLPEKLLRNLVEQLTPLNKAFVLGVETSSGDLVSSGLFVLHRHVCDVFITAMDRDYAKLHPNYLLTAEALLECDRRGVQTLNWQSSAARGNGVYEFKAKWRASERSYWFVSKILGELQPFLALGKTGLSQAYPWHYVLPFGLFDTPGAHHFRKP